ncbi:MAG: DUF1987 domain-containing protein [Crocinitomicaceae bacterium]
MEKLHIEGSAKTPSVSFDGQAGILEMRGRSIPENSIEFFQPLMDWIDGYGSSPTESTQVDMKLEYFNTSSSKCILDLFKRLEKINNGNSSVLINWFYETDDEDMQEAGEDYAAIVDLKFEIQEIDEI